MKIHRSAWRLVVLSVLALAAGLAIASNLAFKLPYTVTGPAGVGGQGTGKNLVSLPYRPKPSVTNAYELMLDIGGGSVTPVTSIMRYNTESDTLVTYTGRMGAGTPFSITPGEAYLVHMAQNVDYRIVGAHDGSIGVRLGKAGDGSQSGKHWLAVPYNTTVHNAYELMLDIGGGSITPDHDLHPQPESHCQSRL